MYYSSDPYPGHSIGEVGSMSVPRVYAVSAIVWGPGGTLFVAGGDVSPTANGEVFDSSTGRFYSLGGMYNYHGRGTATSVFANETVTIAGGLDLNGHITNATDIYYFAVGFELGNPLNYPRAEHAASLLNNGQVLVTGGTDSTGADLSSAELLQ